jgi:hypothetical protein
LTDAVFSGILSVSQGRRAENARLFSFILYLVGGHFMATMKDIIQSPLLALFGSMALGLFASSASGSKVVKGGIKGVLPVLIIMTVLSLAARLAGYGSVLGGLVGIFIIVMLPIGILTSYVLWKKGKIQVVDKEQK